MAVEPPLLEGIVSQRCYRSVVVREGFEGDVESPHRRGEYGYGHDEPCHLTTTVCDSQICAFTDTMNQIHGEIIAISVVTPYLVDIGS